MMTDYSQEEKAVAVTSVFKMKGQQIVEEHLEDTYGTKMILEEDAHEEDEKIQMEDLEQAPLKFEDT